MMSRVSLMGGPPLQAELFKFGSRPFRVTAPLLRTARGRPALVLESRRQSLGKALQRLARRKPTAAQADTFEADAAAVGGLRPLQDPAEDGAEVGLLPVPTGWCFACRNGEWNLGFGGQIDH